MKGIILAGGKGSRLYPLTKVVSKQLQPVYDKPMIYYPLSILMLGGIQDILIITNPWDRDAFEDLLGNGEQFGVRLSYKIQETPDGLPEAFKLGADFIGNDDVTLILGDNLFYGDITFFRKAISAQINKTDRYRGRIFAYNVANPSAYGVVEFDKQTKGVKSIEEKPSIPKSNFAIPGLYIFDSSVVEKARSLKPSSRGETEIVDLIKIYLAEERLGVEMITRGVAWLDTGTPKFLLEASEFIGAIEARQGLKVACLEEIAARMGFIDGPKLNTLIAKLPQCEYRLYLEKLYEQLEY